VYFNDFLDCFLFIRSLKIEERENTIIDCFVWKVQRGEELGHLEKQQIHLLCLNQFDFELGRC